MLAIDSKGENARVAGEARRVHVLDPFEVSGMPSTAYNPLDLLTPDSLDLGGDAASLTEALVMDPTSQVQEAHWKEEAKAILGELIMFCVYHEDRDCRSLATVREYLTLPPDRLKALLELVQDSDEAGGLIACAASRFARESGPGNRLHPVECAAAHPFPRLAPARKMPRAVRLLLLRSAASDHLRPPGPAAQPDGSLQLFAALLVTQALQYIARDAEVAPGP